MNGISYPGYSARIEYDERDNHLTRRILAIISFHGHTVDELHEEFEHAVDDDLTECPEKGVSPEKPASGMLLLRASPEVHSGAMGVAGASVKKLNRWVAEVFERVVMRSAFACA